MFKRIILPGSGVEEGGGATAGAAGRLSEDELGALSEVARWWRNRGAVGDSAAPLETHFGGVDAVGSARTLGNTTSSITFAQPLLPTDAAAFLVLALGITSDRAASFGLAGMCHFHRLPDGDWYSRYHTFGRSPSDHDAEVRSAIDLGSGQSVVQIRGISGLTIDWKVELYRLEWA